MDYQRYFEIAIAIFNENVGSDFTVDNVVPVSYTHLTLPTN